MPVGESKDDQELGEANKTKRARLRIRSLDQTLSLLRIVDVVEKPSEFIPICYLAECETRYVLREHSYLEPTAWLGSR